VDVGVVTGTPWVVDHRGDRVVRIDPSTNQVTTSVSVGPAPFFIAVASSRLWVGTGSELTGVDPMADLVLTSLPIGAPVIAGAGDTDGVWVVAGHTVVRVDAALAAVTTRIDFGRGTPVAVAAPGWVALAQHDLVSVTGSGTYTLGSASPAAVVVGDRGAVWVTDVGRWS
jgi:YVTN family beta-propeller protein